MRQVAGLISTYSSDEFGVCSALFELGGMVVMHDASGCNSTYTTHDETRWYDMDSMIYISAISEMEAIMGDDQKLIDDLTETALELKPAFIAVVGAPIPYMIGTDLEAIAAVVEENTRIPAFGLAANGMHNYLTGISMALTAVVDRFCRREVPKARKLTVNIMGATPLDFSLNGSVDSMKAWIKAEGMEVGVCFAMGSTLEEIALSSSAHVNLVVSYGGIPPAKKMEELFGIPYVVGIPFGEQFSKHLAELLKISCKTGESRVAYDLERQEILGQQELLEGQQKQEPQEPLEEQQRQEPLELLEAQQTQGSQKMLESEKNMNKTVVPEAQRLVMIGESVYSASLAEAIKLEQGIQVQVLCPLETEKEFLRAGDLMTPEEDDLLDCVKHVRGIIADPLYRGICPEGTAFYELPHEAFSGRIYDKVNPNLIYKKMK